MTLGVSNVSRIHFGFKFIVNPDPDPIIEYALSTVKPQPLALLFTQLFSVGVFPDARCPSVQKGNYKQCCQLSPYIIYMCSN